jgi:cell volume regulation protein A
MTIAIIITFCSLLLLAYIFDLTSSKTKIPSVILLLFLGWGVKQVADFFELQIPDLTALLPIFGTIGLILIVLEGSLELEFNKSKIPLIKKSLLVAVLPLVVLSIVLAIAFRYVGHSSFKDSLINAIPLCVISSAIAIPSAKNLLKSDREFITYETSLSDIIGVILFDFFALNETIDFSSFGHFGLQLVIILIISFVATLGLAFLLSKIDHHIKFAPIVVLIILIYVVSKVFHLRL